MAVSEQTQLAAPKRVTLSPTTFWQIRGDIPKLLTGTLSTLSILLPLGLWWLVTQLGWAPPLFLPRPDGVWLALGRLWQSGILQADLQASVLRVLGGFFLAFIISVPLGVMMGAFPSVQSLLGPFVAVVRYMPASAFIPLLIIWLGLGEPPKIMLIFIGTLFFNTLMVADAVKFVPNDWLAAAYTLGANRWQALLTVISPAVLPSIIDAARVNLAASWNLVIVAELVAATSGLGFRISKAQRFLHTDEIFASLIVIGLIGVAFDVSFRLFQRWLCPWVEAFHKK